MILFSLLLCLLSSFAFAAPAALQSQAQSLSLNANFEIPDPLQLQFTSALSAIWNFTKPDKYQYKFRLQCFCTPEFVGPWLITVDNGVSTAELALDEVPPYFDPTLDFSEEIAEQYGTMDKLYDQVISILKDDFATASIEVDFQNYILTSVFIDISEMIADEEFSFVVTEFTELWGILYPSWASW